MPQSSGDGQDTSFGEPMGDGTEVIKSDDNETNEELIKCIFGRRHTIDNRIHWTAHYLAMFIISTVLLLGLRFASAQDANCDFYQQIATGVTYTINSPGWPSYYRPGITCRWIADCPAGYRCRLRCSEISLPQSQSCYLDRLLVSLTGNTQLTDAQTYCGAGTLNVLSTSNRLSMALISDARSAGGRFTCQIAAESSSPSPGSCRCGDRRATRIVGGVETGVNEYPSMVGLVDARISQIVCGGVIISNWYVLTAAHCVVGESPSNYAAIVGEHDVTVGDSPATQGYRISAFIVHPSFTESNYDYDVSIARVTNAIAFSDYVGPVCLPFKFRNTNLAGAMVTMLGWGTLFPGGPNSNTLQKVSVMVMAQTSCQSQVSTLTDRQICTLTPGKDACQNDSGGPVLYYDYTSGGRLFSVGIISYGRFCASGYPGINTRVTALLDWIVQNTPDADYCVVQ